jgi:hypothetical protein
LELRPKPRRGNCNSKTFLVKVRVGERLRLTIKPLGNRAEKPSDALQRLESTTPTKNSEKSALRGSYELPSFQQCQNATLFIKYDKFTV